VVTEPVEVKDGVSTHIPEDNLDFVIWDNLFSRSSLYFVIITGKKVPKLGKNPQ
jgi:hypothetical protein